MPNFMPSSTVLRVLVADDIKNSRELVCNSVRAFGHSVDAVQSGNAVLERMQSAPPDLILLDLLMPGMDGFEVIAQLRNLTTDRWLPVIVTSSLQGQEHFIEALQRGADDYLVRPINPALLDAKLRHYAKVLGLQSHLGVLAQRQRDIHNNILDAVITFNSDGYIEENNLAALRIFGNGSTPLKGVHCQTLVGVSLEAMMLQSERTLTRADGAQFPAELAFSQWSSDQQTHYTFVVRDLTKRHRVERMKDEFLATVSHELRTPLTSILGALNLLASGAAGALPEPLRPFAEIAQRNGQRLSRLIDDILDLTKLEGDQMVFQMRCTHLPPLLEEALNANQGYAQRAQVRLTSLCEANCPEVRLDAERFLQVMANLLSNAIKHSHAGDTVSVELTHGAALVQIKVRDQGPGVDPKFRARMFEKFSQADGSDQRIRGGTGLGLYITRMLIDRMGGHIAVDSQPDRGATFIVSLPVLQNTSGPPPPWLLHIDRDIDVRRRVASWLSPLYNVKGASDLQQAQDLMAHAKAPLPQASLILADPQAQGLAEAFCATLQHAAKGKPLILLSDTVDAQFVRNQGLRWLPKAETDQAKLLSAVALALTQHLTNKAL